MTTEDADSLDRFTESFDEDRQAELHKQVETAIGESFSGMWISFERRGFVVATTNPVDAEIAHIKSSLPIVEIVEARNSKSTIEREYEKFRKNGDEIYSQAKLTSLTVDVSCGLLIATSTLPSKDATQILGEHFTPGTFFVSPIAYRERSLLNKQAAHDPLVAGVNIRPTGSSVGGYCTTNNVWQKGAEIWLVTAAHCIPPGNVNIPQYAHQIFTTNNLHWYQGPNNSEANRVSRYNLQYAKFQGGTDAVAIQARLNHRSFSDDFHWIQDNFFPYTTHFGDTTSWVPVPSGSQGPWLGYPLCQSGQRSNQPYCGSLYTIYGTGVGFSTELGFTTYFHDMLEANTIGCPGDSGTSGYFFVSGTSWFLTGVLHGGGGDFVPGLPLDCGAETYYSSVGWMHLEIGLTNPYGV